jgi:hypothetical protein
MRINLKENMPVEARTFFEDCRQVDLFAVGIEEICFVLVATEEIGLLVHDGAKHLRYKVAKITNDEVAR